ncbi:hypothetical protein CUT44_24510 [Streptomyces carminius]|uniref:Uncharacterized protein n=1 Tax=Streptomyces carminius TaxID=2665496 RepID=A0A2M8LSB6_9ACTN|nr:hypothetical protein [Streptomyces carminius]PJE94860.1 hypothetical protein CUT44_24510 [Streptomyces carminius]
MSPMLDVSDDVRAEIGDEEAARLLAGDSAPDTYDCTSCRAPGDIEQERTSTVLFVGEETAVLAFAHASCVPSQVIAVSEEQLQDAVRTFAGGRRKAGVPDAPGIPSQAAAPDSASGRTADPAAGRGESAPRPAVLGVTCGQVLIDDQLHPALVIEPTAPIARPGSGGSGDDFLPLLAEQGFLPVEDVARAPLPVTGWSVLLAMGRLHAILQPGVAGGRPTSWWQAHQPLPVTDEWRTAAHRTRTVLVYAAPVGAIGQQPREDLLREALEKAAAQGVLVAAAMPVTGS